MSIDVRAKLAELMTATLADSQHWTYREIRPLAVPASWKPGQLVKSDCSKGVQFLVAWASKHDPKLDPCGNDYADWGNSTTICAHLQHLASPSDLLVGDPVTFGPDGDAHAAMVLEPGSDPLLWSDGHQGAPNTYRLSQDGREHQCLRLPVPAYVPTADDLLRAKTGYWSWMQWKLGEGDWKHHYAGDPSVRPHVPVRIDLAWWKRREVFMARRLHGNPPTAR